MIYSALFILYSIGSMFVMGMAVLFPFAFGMKDCPPTFVIVEIYVLTLIIMVTQEKCITFFRNKLQF